MEPADSAVAAGDPYNLERFIRAQQDGYDQALVELRSGRKRSHWMWFVFPQFEGLGSSWTSRFFAIKSIGEAQAYVAHPVLGPRLVECAEAVLRIEGPSANEIFGSPDDLKLRSCATLFAFFSPQDSIFHRILDRYFEGQRDEKTLRLIGAAAGPSER